MDSVSIKHFYELNGKTYLREVNLKPETITDGLCNKIWAGTFYNNIISSSNSNRTKLEIINKSIEFEVLTDYTAFLALEREDNSSYGENRDEWLINVNSLLGLESFAIKAYPNPFTDHIFLDFNLSNETKNKEYYKNYEEFVKNLIKKDPTSRRIILSAWNPCDLNKMALPPCHVLSQFHVLDNKLSCTMYQRSGDVGLGIPFNVASYSFLTILLAHHCGLEPGEFIHFIGNAHIYEEHEEVLLEQIKREPYNFPKCYIYKKYNEIDYYKVEDFVIKDYKYHDKIKMEMKA